MKMMTKTFAALSLALLGSTAQAGNLNWEGWYGGLTLGNNHSSADWETTDYLAPTSAIIPIPFTGDNSTSLDDDALLTDGFVGYNWSIAPSWVAGVELHIGYADNNDTQNLIPGIDRGSMPMAGYSSVEIESGWNSSLRGRIGYAFMPRLLAYATAGIAITDIDTTTSCPRDTNVCNPGFPALENKDSERTYGYIAGVGLEMALTDQLTGRIEYTYADYGTQSMDGLPALDNRSFGFNGDVDLTNQALSAGIAYHF